MTTPQVAIGRISVVPLGYSPNGNRRHEVWVLQADGSTCQGRATLSQHGMGFTQDELRNLESTIRRGFDAQSPVGQMLRGERDFWRNQLKREAAK